MKYPEYYEQFKDCSYLELNSRLCLACEKGWLEEISYLLTSSDLPINASLNYDNGLPLTSASKKGKLEIIKFLLTSPNLKNHANIHSKNDMALSLACKYGHLETVNYLLTSPDLKEHANISANNYEPIAYACQGGHLNILKYLLTSKKLEKFDIHLDEDLIFRTLIEKQNIEALSYIIFDLNIEFTEVMKQCLEYINSPIKNEINKIFELRNLNKDLINDLSINTNSSKRNKV
jgi:ankyrin repeat protein